MGKQKKSAPKTKSKVPAKPKATSKQKKDKLQAKPKGSSAEATSSLWLGLFSLIVIIFSGREGPEFELICLPFIGLILGVAGFVNRDRSPILWWGLGINLLLHPFLCLTLLMSIEQ